MSDSNVRRCSLCGAWAYMTAEDRLRVLMGESMVCEACKKKGVKPRVA
jgi:hypothetical protein